MTQTTKIERLLTETVEALRDLAGALIDNMPPQAQSDIAEIQVKLLLAVKEFEE